MASSEQQTAKASGGDQEEETEDILMDTEEELIRAEDTEQLKPEAVSLETAAASGKSLVSRLMLSVLFGLLSRLPFAILVSGLGE